MDLNLKGRLALVTGSTRGLGRTIAEVLAEEGAEVIITGRNKESLTKAVKEMKSKFPLRAWGYTVDATDTEAVGSLFRTSLIALRGKLDILVNNVGNIEKFGSFTELTDEDWFRCYNLTFMSAVRFTREALPFLKASGSGKIINISSIISHQPGSFPQYSSSKAALNNLTKYLANNLAKDKILVNGICPSSLKSGAWGNIVRDKAKRENITFEEAEKIIEKRESEKSPIGRMGTHREIAEQVVMLASDKNSYMTGEIINVDGGSTRGF
jgi:3-oxoacyl-[acyl-carrier protein] reductase